MVISVKEANVLVNDTLNTFINGYTVKRVLFVGVNVCDIEITANSRFLIFALDRIKI